MPVPITLLVDDSCPLIHVYRFHWEHVHHKPPVTADGRPLLDTIPNTFLDQFCDVVEANGMAGKFSIVPAPAGRGDVTHGIKGYDPAVTRSWLDTAKRRLSSRFDFTPEGITHDLAVDLSTGRFFEQSESDWSQTQAAATLTPYLTRELELLRDAGIDATGFTSPWVFGIEVEPEYITAMVEAQKAIYGRRFSWYFLHMLHDRPDARPWIAYRQEDTTLVAIPSTVDDFWWQTIDSSRSDEAFIQEIADSMLTTDGRGGKIRSVINGGGWPVLLTHWQSLFSNGLETGLRALDELGRRITLALGDEVEWVSCLEMASRVEAFA
ncbi:MAG TPA: hypothetical protein VFJ58_04090 [Armatimonadota bacterium]|nr:hypothetical protein [Armatimonadota bacterium]